MMLKIIPAAVLVVIILSIYCGNLTQSGHSGDYPIQAVPFTQIQLTDHFWAKRIEINRTVTIPFGLQKCEEEGRIRNFAKAGGLMEGEYEGKMPFDDSDIYKIIEGISYSLQTNPDSKLDAYVDDIIALIDAAQEDDGYLCTWKTLNPDTTPAPWVKPGPRWYDLRSSHELYNAGHMYEAAYAHFRATGKRNFLDIALKNADLIIKTFGPDKLMTPPGHQIIETGLVKLYRATGKQKYLDQAKFFLDQRGNAQGHELYGDYNQDHQPVTEQSEAVGHAVRALYMYAGMTDIAALLHDTAYLQATDHIWENAVTKKLYITGGLGARHQGEAFGDNYELPNLTSYNETCAAIANVYWNHRMFLLHGESKYIDILERTLYNGLISGVAMEGNTFFYPNCLASDGKYPFNQGALTRKPWFDCSCCPSNIIRFMPSVPDYIYAVREDTLYVNLFIANRAEVKMNQNTITLTQQTDYPWDGKITITVNPAKTQHSVINIRIPGWAQGQPVPGDLYQYLPNGNDQVTLAVNGEKIQPEMQKGYAVIQRDWQAGDVIELNLLMPVNRVIANENVQDDLGKVALERGPIVYCAEWVDNGGKALDLALADNAVLSTEYNPDLLGGVTILKGEALNNVGKKSTLTAIPYYAWSHRGPGEMSVWLNRKL
ncbi:MAG TPA: glycoside hydrolase family 127 protein [bacterium]|nr:glycoside hydrolase family 127 protein [bacterium]HPN43422.1 glycoside hydrolase family 127 protein [bacterium]